MNQVFVEYDGGLNQSTEESIMEAAGRAFRKPTSATTTDNKE